MKLALLLFPLVLTATAVGQSAVPSYEPGQLANYLKKLQSEEEDCRRDKKGCESFLEDESVSKKLGTSLGVQGCSQIVTNRIRLDGLHEAGFVRMQCGWDLNLVFTEKRRGGWRFLETLIVPNKYEEATVKVASVTGDESQQVIVHKSQAESGTGIKQQNFLVYKFLEGRIRLVLDAVESAYLTYPWTDHEVSQDSRFVYEAPTKDELKKPDSTATFRETQVLEFAGVKVELIRDHTWSPERQAFLASQWISVRTLPGKKSPASE